MSGGTTTVTAASQISRDNKSFIKAASKNADADLKTKLDGVMEAFRAGRMPNNPQIDDILLYISRPPIDMARLSPDGQSFVTHFRDLMDSTRLWIKEKNAGELLQNFVWHWSTNDLKKTLAGANVATAADKEHSKAVGKLATLSLYIFFIINPDIRKLLAEGPIVNNYISTRNTIKNAGKPLPANEILSDGSTKEWRDQYVYRVQKFYLSCQVQEEYMASMNWLKEITVSWLLYYAANDANTGSQGGPLPTADSAVRRSAAELRALLERFTKGGRMSNIENASRAFYEVAGDDEDFCKWYHEADNLLNKVLYEPGFVASDACYDQWEQLTDSSRPPFDPKYKVYKENMVDSISAWFVAIAEDPLMMRFGSDWKRLSKDVLFDADGHLTFKPQLLGDIHRVILPALIGDLDYIPIPRIEYTSSMMDLAIENLAFQGRSLFPSVLSLQAPATVEALPADAGSDNGRQKYQFTFSHAQTYMPGVAFYFKKKTGFPSFTDSGFADVSLGGEGLIITIQLETVENDSTRVLNLTDVKVVLDSLKFTVRGSKHDFLYNILTPLIIGLLKSQTKNAVIEGVTNGFEAINEMLVQAKEKEQDRMVEAQGTDEQSRRAVLKRISERNRVSSKKAETADSQFRIAFTADSESLPKAGPRNQPEKEAVLQVGRSWRSAAFSIVNTVPDAPATAYTNTTLV